MVQLLLFSEQKDETSKGGERSIHCDRFGLACNYDLLSLVELVSKLV